jgi:RNA polymerase sigma-B factor
VSSTVERLEHHLGRAPSVAEISASCGVDEHHVEVTLRANGAYRTSSLDVLDRPDHPEPVVDTGDRLAELTTRDALSRLDERTRTILYLRFFEDRTQGEIGARVGVGQVQVSRLIRSALDDLRTTLEPTGVR